MKFRWIGSDTISQRMIRSERAAQEDSQLIQGMAERDATALEVFYDRHHRVAFSLILRIVDVREDAEDVLADVFWQVWQQAARYEASRGKPLAWLLTIARTRAIDCRRASGRLPTPAGDELENLKAPAPGKTPDKFVEADTRRAVRNALDSLPEEQRIPLELAYFEGMSHSEIAAALKQPLGTMKDRIRSGMLHLKKTLKAYV